MPNAARDDIERMQRAVANAARVRLLTPPNPWVGAVLVSPSGDVFDGATSEPGGPHAEVDALRHAGDAARGATLYVTLEPCSHHGRTGPCADAVIAAGVARVVVGIEDPDPNVAGSGIARLRDAGVRVDVGPAADEICEQLRPYLVHRRTGRPYVVLKLAATLDGRIAAPDGSSQWITGASARADVHRLRAESGAVVVGAGTVRADDPTLTVRDFRPPPPARPTRGLDPQRVVLGAVPAGSRVEPARSHRGDIGALLDALGAEGVLQVLVEGGADVAGRFHRGGFVDEYVVYLAPALTGGEDSRPMFAGSGIATMGELWRGRFVSVDRLGDDVRLVLRRGDGGSGDGASVDGAVRG